MIVNEESQIIATILMSHLVWTFVVPSPQRWWSSRVAYMALKLGRPRLPLAGNCHERFSPSLYAHTRSAAERLGVYFSGSFLVARYEPSAFQALDAHKTRPALAPT